MSNNSDRKPFQMTLTMSKTAKQLWLDELELQKLDGGTNTRTLNTYIVTAMGVYFQIAKDLRENTQKDVPSLHDILANLCSENNLTYPTNPIR